jgi:hypothetical protein
MAIEELLRFNIQNVPSLANAYVSDAGDVFTRDRRVTNVLNPRKPYLGRVGYYVVQLPDKEKNATPRYIHRMVAEAFLPPQEADHEVRHLDGTRTNNAASNLAWGTRRDNVHDAIRHGTHRRGQDAGAAKLNNEDVEVIRYLLKRGASCYAIARVFSVVQSTISDIRDGHTWSHTSNAPHSPDQ